MPHSTTSARDAQGRRVCPYCGHVIAHGFQVTCPYHSDLPALEPFDDRYLLRKDNEA